MKIPASVAEKCGLYIPTIITDPAAAALLSDGHVGRRHIITTTDAEAVIEVLVAVRVTFDADHRWTGVVKVPTTKGTQEFTYHLDDSDADEDEAPTLFISIA